jgi:hypothetical protein
MSECGGRNSFFREPHAAHSVEAGESGYHHDEAMTKVKQPDAFMHNFYKSNAAKMGEWHTASHVERQAKAKKPATPPPAKP